MERKGISGRATLWMMILGMTGYLGTGAYLSSRMSGAERVPKHIVLTDSLGNDALTLTTLRTDSLSTMPPGGAADRSAPRVSMREVVFNRDPVLLVWVTLMCMMVAFSFGTAPLFAGAVIQLRAQGVTVMHVGWRAVVALFTGAALTYLPTLTRNFWPAKEMTAALDVMLSRNGDLQLPVAVTLISAMIGVVAMLCIPVAADKLLERIKGMPAPDEDTSGEHYQEHRQKAAIAMRTQSEQVMRAFMRLRRLSGSLLSLLAVLVAFAVLTSGALRESVLGLVKVPGLDVFPIEFVHMYGLFFTAFLAIIYLPVHFHLRMVEAVIAEKFPDAFATTDVRSSAPAGKRGFTAVPWNEIKTATAVLAPLISSFLPDQLKNVFG